MGEGKVQLLWGALIAVWLAAIFFIPPQWSNELVVLGIPVSDAVMLVILIVFAVLVWIVRPKEWNWWVLAQHLSAALVIAFGGISHNSGLVEAAVLAFIANLTIADLVAFNGRRMGALR